MVVHEKITDAVKKENKKQSKIREIRSGWGQEGEKQVASLSR